MPRRKRFDKIFNSERSEIEDLSDRLQSQIQAAQRELLPFNVHYNALSALSDDLHKAVNILNDRDPDWRRPHHAPMSQGRRSQ